MTMIILHMGGVVLCNLLAYVAAAEYQAVRPNPINRSRHR